MSQMKEQGKNLQDQINEEEIGNLPEIEFRVMIAKMIQNSGKKCMHRERRCKKVFSKELENIKNNKQSWRIQ